MEHVIKVNQTAEIIGKVSKLLTCFGIGHAEAMLGSGCRVYTRGGHDGGTNQMIDKAEQSIKILDG